MINCMKIILMQKSMCKWTAIIMQRANFAYQFREEKQVYYPNRKLEMQRNTDITQTQLVVEPQKDQTKKLPRDYYYKILGVSKIANTQQIKHAYYALAKRFHPDTNQSPQETKRFQEISNAYHILTDDTKRLEYDQLGMVTDEQNFLRKFDTVWPTMGTKSAADVARPQTPDELRHMTNSDMQLDLTFLEAAHGTKKTLNLSYLNKCSMCNGRAPKMATRTKQEACRKCDGTGKITKRTQTYTAVTVCDTCSGKRFISRNQCETCDSRGIVMEQVKVTVTVPAGSRHGDVISLENPNTKQRVTYRINVLESDMFKRKGNDVYTEEYISISQALLGATIKVKGIYEDLVVTVEPGTESHTVVRVKGKGIKTREAVGDHLVIIKIRIPRELSMKQRQLVQAWAKTENKIDT